FSRFIEEGLVYDDNAQIDGAIRRILSTTQDEGIAMACMKRLVGRGFDADIEAYIQKRAKDKNYAESFKEMTSRLGWSRIHVAVERKQADWVRNWIAQGKEVTVSGNTGDTPIAYCRQARQYESRRFADRSQSQFGCQESCRSNARTVGYCGGSPG